MKKVRLNKINIVAEHYEKTIAFYRMLGLNIPEVHEDPPQFKHSSAVMDNGSFAIDNSELATVYNAGWRKGGRKSILLTAQLDSRKEVDETFNSLVAAGHAAVQVPFDAFWGSRYAIVMDPEGNWVGIESPRGDKSMNHWPPKNSPDAS